MTEAMQKARQHELAVAMKALAEVWLMTARSGVRTSGFEYEHRVHLATEDGETWAIPFKLTFDMAGEPEQIKEATPNA